MGGGKTKLREVIVGKVNTMHQGCPASHIEVEGSFPIKIQIIKKWEEGYANGHDTILVVISHHIGTWHPM